MVRPRLSPCTTCRGSPRAGPAPRSPAPGSRPAAPGGCGWRRSAPPRRPAAAPRSGRCPAPRRGRPKGRHRRRGDGRTRNPDRRRGAGRRAPRAALRSTKRSAGIWLKASSNGSSIHQRHAEPGQRVGALGRPGSGGTADRRGGTTRADAARRSAPPSAAVGPGGMRGAQQMRVAGMHAVEIAQRHDGAARLLRQAAPVPMDFHLMSGASGWAASPAPRPRSPSCRRRCRWSSGSPASSPRPAP